MSQSTNRVPVGFIDEHGYVTPFNGIIDETLKGWYIYDKEQYKKAIAQQRKLEESRIVEEIGVRNVKYFDDALADGPTKVDDKVKDAVRSVLGDDDENIEPFLQLAKKEQRSKGAERRAKKKETTVVTDEDLHKPADNLNLTDEEREFKAGEAPDIQKILNTVMTE